MKNYLFPVFYIGLLAIAYFYNNPIVDMRSNKGEGIHFQMGNLPKALENAKASGKPVFLDVHASWCGYCKKMKAYVFSKKETGNFYNDNFINVAVDGESPEGISLVKKFNIQSYPTILFLDADGNLLSKSEGYIPTDEFNKYGQSILSALKKGN